jgi:8-oxo-dGTP diphosphatase
MKLATLCYIRLGGKMLMLHRKPKPDLRGGLWNGLGGKLDEGETPEACIIREVREESGLTIERPRLRGFLTFPPDEHNGGNTWHVLLFEATEFAGTLVPDHTEGSLEWIPESEVFDLDMFEGDRLFLRWMLDGEPFFLATFRYDAEDKLQRHEVSFHPAA